MAAPNQKRDINLTRQQRQAIALEIVNRKANSPCARCGDPSPTLAPRITYIQLQALGDAISGAVDESSIPTAVFICRNCGWLAMHSLGILGMMGQVPGPDGGDWPVSAASRMALEYDASRQAPPGSTDE